MDDSSGLADRSINTVTYFLTATHHLRVAREPIVIIVIAEWCTKSARDSPRF